MFNIWVHFPTAATHSSFTEKWHMRNSAHCQLSSVLSWPALSRLHPISNVGFPRSLCLTATLVQPYLCFCKLWLLLLWSRSRLFQGMTMKGSIDMTGLGTSFTQLRIQNALVEWHKNEQASCIEVIGLTAPQLLPHWSLVRVSTSVTSHLFSVFFAT